MPSNRFDVMKIRRKSSRCFIEEGFLFQRGFDQAPLRCLEGDEMARALEEVDSGVCGNQQESSRLFKELVHLGYYWPTMEGTAGFFLKGANHVISKVIESTSPAVELHILSRT